MQQRKNALNSDIWSGVIVLVVAGVGWWESRGFSELGGVFVRWVVGALAMLGLALLVKGVVSPEYRRALADRRDLPAVGIVLASLVAYVALVPVVGFVLASSAFASGLAITLLGDRRTFRRSFIASLVGIGVSIGLYVVFQHGFSVPLPRIGLWGIF